MKATTEQQATAYGRYLYKRVQDEREIAREWAKSIDPNDPNDLSTHVVNRFSELAARYDEEWQTFAAFLPFIARLIEDAEIPDA